MSKFFRKVAVCSAVIGSIPGIAYMQGPPSNLLPGDSNITQVLDFYTRVCWATQWIMIFGLIIGVLFIIYGGVRYITSAGDSSKTNDAKNTILTAIIGVVFLLLSGALINIVANFFGSGGFQFSLMNCSSSGGFSFAPPAGAPSPTASTGGNPPPPPPPPPPGGTASPTPTPTASTGGVPAPPPPPPP